MTMLDVDYSCVSDFWDNENKRSLSIAEAVAEGYFSCEEEAQEYLETLECDEGLFL